MVGKVKVGEMEYPDRYNKTGSEFLGRTKINVEEAVVTKPNEKHTDNILKLLGLENCKPSPVPGKKLEVNENTEKPLSESEKKVYQSCVGSAIYLSQDRIDIKFSRRMKEPRYCDMANLKILGRYLKGTKHLGHIAKIESMSADERELLLHAFCDSDYAGDSATRKSTSGEILLLGGTVVEASSSTQTGNPATSSGEAELRSLNHCAQSSIYSRNLALNDFGLPVATPRVWCDSSAALQAAKRIGVGKIRHISLAHLYVQELTRTKHVIIGKVIGDSNPADCLTKYLPTGEAVKKGRELAGMVNLCKEGLDDHVRKTALTKVSAVCFERKNNVERWQPISASRLSIRQFSSVVHKPYQRELPH